MKVVLFTHFFFPHVGGVEKHVENLAIGLKNLGHEVFVITKKYNDKLKVYEKINGVEIYRIEFPNIKILGVLKIWKEIFRLRKLIHKSDIVHIHDIFIWYLPFKFLFPFKKIITTIHGLEWDNPLKINSILQKKVAVYLSNRSIGVGRFLEKYLNLKFDLITYGAADLRKVFKQKQKNRFVYVGRLEANTGLLKFLNYAKGKNLKIDFCGDGGLKNICQNLGVVHGFCDPKPFLQKADYCVPGGYLAALEALNNGCKIKLFWNNKVKENYWKMSPFYKDGATKWSNSQTWDKLIYENINLYNS